MKTQRQLAGVRIISLIGQQGTGKTTLAQALADKLDAQFIEASTVVSAVTGITTRGEMYKTNLRTKQEPDWLGEGIAEYIVSDVVILSGVREDENHQYFRKHGANVEVISLWAPEQERFARLKNIGKVEHYKDFVRHGDAEMSIGLRELLELHPPQYVTTYNTVDDLVDRILAREASIYSSDSSS